MYGIENLSQPRCFSEYVCTIKKENPSLEARKFKGKLYDFPLLEFDFKTLFIK